MIQIVSTNHTNGNCYPSIGGVGGFNYQSETTTVEWSDGTRLIVEGYYAKAIYQGTSYELNQINTSLHDGIVEHWKRAISIRLQRDVEPSTRLQDRLRNWNADTNRAA